VLLNPLPLLLNCFGIVAACFLLDMLADDIRERRPGSCEVFREVVNLAVDVIAQDQTLLGIEHRQPARHVVERNLEPLVEPC
jgi:hypothetical protein